ncbi:biotin synthase [Clostridium pasteurianum DSM 525 = ATCC 6013]|uniref:Biotin synthase n=1 Tax=Clostridium pasteurianum DSM 525 = ATCC 6013 TaxID=1262449 RepID=A0A0H3J483_CLOPA|nr:biotin synthase BioB [Clostridium pasteurianum]AJA46723.1 biotin synthase [Clostridium pasteurianum DSM 525 = ATCC 6013]AJA50711.1 biotin synthase [Clostridium pasteurianum DSM 525 = ATCC 6013]AOZ74124.1 biotin synthase [Clostridium pasteurianum DSM 525 = ATCC 6013]AOZ77921.1 biotin synthase [Clostridium pasteurianum]ELP61290.1 biotin synthase [Clostridium pasteurianum DSM 525 = ATCC 6013]
MDNIISKLEKKINEGQLINYEEALELAKTEDFKELITAADRIRDKFNGKVVDICSIMNAKSGKCTEDCKYCAQSAHYKTNVQEYDLVGEEEAVKLAKENESCGVNRFSLVTSGRALTGEEFKRAIKIYSTLRDEVKMDLCASLGIITEEQLEELKGTGITMYHHNLETSRDYYGKICTTHSYEERIETIEAAKKAGLRVCSGGIIGMGETIEDRIKMAMELQKLQVYSIPVNVLNPVKGTPLEDAKSLTDEEILRTIAVFRFINPKSQIRLAGGRSLIAKEGQDCLRAGANATISGNYLTTVGNKIEDDIKMIKEVGMEVV